MFFERLKFLRKEKKLTQKDFAKMISVSPSTVAMWETGKREPDFETIKNLAEFFEVSTDYLLDNTDDPTPQNQEPILDVYVIGRGGSRVIFDIPPEQVSRAKKLLDLLVEDDIEGL